MTTVQTIELNDNERLTLQKAMGIINDMAAIAKTSENNVFDYLCEVAEIKDNREYSIKALHNIHEMQ